MSINVGIVGFVGMDKSGVGKYRFGVAVVLVHLKEPALSVAVLMNRVVLRKRLWLWVLF